MKTNEQTMNELRSYEAAEASALATWTAATATSKAFKNAKNSLARVVAEIALWSAKEATRSARVRAGWALDAADLEAGDRNARLADLAILEADLAELDEEEKQLLARRDHLRATMADRVALAREAQAALASQRIAAKLPEPRQIPNESPGIGGAAPTPIRALLSEALATGPTVAPKYDTAIRKLQVEENDLRHAIEFARVEAEKERARLEEKRLEGEAEKARARARESREHSALAAKWAAETAEKARLIEAQKARDASQ